LFDDFELFDELEPELPLPLLDVPEDDEDDEPLPEELLSPELDAGVVAAGAAPETVITCGGGVVAAVGVSSPALPMSTPTPSATSRHNRPPRKTSPARAGG